MARNYLHTLFRNFAKTKAYSFINTNGLSIGMAAAVANPVESLRDE
ncbi:hypothetical protein [Parapedobacter sp. 2B3]